MKKLLLLLCTFLCSVGMWAADYVKVTSAPQDWSGTYVLVGNGNGNGKTYAFNGTDAVNGSTEVTVSDNTISNYTGVTLQVAALQDGGYSVKVVGGDNNGKYISSGSSAPAYSNALKFNDAAHRVDFSMDGGNVVMKQSTTSGDVTIRFNYASDQLRFRFYKSGQQPVELYKQYSGSAVHVSSVTLDQSSVSINADESITLSATVLPANADNKAVTWESNNESVAIVKNGVVTGVDQGTATITVKTEDGNYTATCDVTVQPSQNVLAYTFDFTVNNFNLPTSAKKNEEASYTYDGKTITLWGDAGNGFKFNSSYLIMGKTGAYLKLPAFDFPISKIVVVGNNGASATVGQNIFVGETAVSTATSGATGTNVYIIDKNYQAVGTVYTLKVTTSSNTQITSVQVYRAGSSIPVTVSGAGYSTFYCKEYAVELPTGVEGYVWDDGLVKVYDGTTSDNVIPADEPVVLKAAAGNYALEYTTTETPTYKSIDSNSLCGASSNMTASQMASANAGTNYFYALSLNSAGEANSIGFYWRNNGGAAFDITAGKAYLVLPKTAAPVRGFAFNGGEATAIKTVNTTANNTVRYNLAGQRVNANAKGIIVTNGKKHLVK